MSSIVDSPTGTTGPETVTADPLPPPPSTDSPLNTPTDVSPPSSVTTATSFSTDTVELPMPPQTSPSGDGADGLTPVSTDGGGFIYTTTIYSTQNPSAPTSTPIPSPNSANAGHIGAIVAGVAGGVGLLFLLAGVTWFILARRAKRRAGTSIINDRKFYPDRYNQTVESNRHGRFNEIEPGPVVVQPPPPPHQTPPQASDPPSRRISSYHNHAPSSRPTRGNWVGVPPADGISGPDIQPLARQRFPYPSSPSQPLADPYTMLPEYTPAYNVNVPTAPLRFAADPHRPHHPRSSSSAHRSNHSHRSHHSHHSHHSRLHHHRTNADHDSYFPPIPVPTFAPAPPRMTRRTTILISPTMPPSSLPTFSNPPPDPPTTLTTQSSIGRSTFSSDDSLVVLNETKRMTVTNPDSDVDPESETEPDRSSGGRGSTSTTDIIRFYDRDQDQDTSPPSSIPGEKDNEPSTDPPSPTASTITAPGS